jgi:hypothetical protein
MGRLRFTRLTNGFSKKLNNHVGAVAHYNLCRVREAPGVAGRTWSIGQLVDAALAVVSPSGWASNHPVEE